MNNKQRMLFDITQVKLLNDYLLELVFEDSKKIIVDISTLIDFKDIFSPLEDLNYFNQVKVDFTIGTICWPNGADLDPKFFIIMERQHSLQ